MEVAKVPVLYISSPVAGIVKINGNSIGQTGPSFLCVPVLLDTTNVVSFDPLENGEGHYFLPFSRQVTFSQQNFGIFDDDGLVELEIYPRDLFHITLHPPSIAVERPRMPYSLQSQELTVFNRIYIGTIYFDRTFNFALQNKSSGRIELAYTFPQEVINASMEVRRIQNAFYLMVLAKHPGANGTLLIIRAGQELQLEFAGACVSYEIDAEGIGVTRDFDDVLGRCELAKYGFDQESGALRHMSTQIQKIGNKKPQSQWEAVSGFFTSIQLRQEEDMREFLDEGLQFSLEEMEQFFGNFISPMPNSLFAEQPGQCGAILRYPLENNIFEAKMFVFDMEQRNEDYKIVNIKEQE